MDRVAIVGIGCRFPGAAGPKAFWEMLCKGVDAVGEIPADRWSIASFYDPHIAARGKTYARWGGFLENMDTFDAGFFGISPREAASMDPQQRVLLEAAWEALEDAGQAPERLAGSAAGVFIGGMTLDYMTLQLSARNREMIATHTAAGALMTMLSNRLSYTFDFRGPSASVDTACSSSLVTTHLACQSLRNRECTVALAGGVNIISTPEYYIAESKGGFLSPDGRCQAFDSRANGYVRAEGAGIVVLKLLDTALADGDEIYAVIRGSAVNQDGRSNGITQPRREAQEALIRDACRRAGVAPRSVQYVEAHGTGTAIGDPIEANAIGTVLSEGRPADRPCIVGSLKTNVGHLEAAAGVAGLIKASLCLEKREIPPNLHFRNPNPQIPFEDLKLKVSTALQPWPAADGPRLAGVNSFGFGGTNAHVVLEEAPACERTSSVADGSAQLLTISAQSAEALEQMAGRYADYLGGDALQHALGDICYSANARRGQHDHRLALAGRSHAEMREGLQAFLAGETRPNLFRGRRTGSRRPKLVFVFTGMGPQWWGMGRYLYREQPVFRRALEACEEVFQRVAGWSVLSAFTEEEQCSRMGDSMVAQTANFALQMALVELWKSWGVQPEAVVGHSAGEPAAACAAGVLSLEDAVTVCYHRSRILAEKAGNGAMYAVQMPVEEVERAIAPYRDRISIAAENSPTSVTLSGDPAALGEVAQQFTERQIWCRALRVNVAYHSYQLDPLKEEMLRSAAGIRPRTAAIPMYSTVTGEPVDGEELEARYWWRNLRSCVYFRETIDRLVDDGQRVFLEVGPHPVLSAAMSDCFANRGEAGHVFPSIRRGEDECANMLASLGGLYTLGFPVDWSRIHPADARFVRQPAYAWQRERYWVESENSRRHRLGESVHPLLGLAVNAPEPSWEVELSRTALPYLADHTVQGAVVYPGAGYVEMALAAAEQLYGPGDYAVEELEFHKALFLGEGVNPKVHVTVRRDEGTFKIYSLPETAEASWVLHASGSVSQKQENRPRRVNVEALSRRCDNEVAKPDCYALFAGQGFQYGPHFQRIGSLRRGFKEALAKIDSTGDGMEAYCLHPAVLDACFQTLIACNPLGGNGVAYMPVGIHRVRAYERPRGTLTCHARIVERSEREMKGDLVLFDAEGEVVLEVKGFHIEALDAAGEIAVTQKLDRSFYEIDWQEAPLQAEGVPAGGSWLIFADAGGTGAELAENLRARGEDAVVVLRGEDADIEGLFRRNPGCRGVAYCRGMDAPRVEDVPVEYLDSADDCLTVMNLTRAMSRLPNPPRLWIVTRGAQATGHAEHEVAAVQAALWGLGRVIGNQEYVGLWGGLIDLDPARSAGEIEMLAHALTDHSGEEVAFRDGRRYIARLVRRKRTSNELPPRFRTDGAYLISGGLGALGLATARWMAERGARRLILMGRSALPARSEWARLGSKNPAVAAIRELEAMGVVVMPASVDVTDEMELNGFLEDYARQNWPPIRGVVHSAGVVRDQLMNGMDDEAFRSVLRPKVAGAVLLHRLTAGCPLEFFTIFSSIGSQVVAAGQANYAAANAFLDSFAHHRRQQGLPAMSINWGPWAVGMVGELNLIEHLTGRGMAPISAARGMQMMDRLFGRGEAQVASLHADWPLVFERMPVVRPLILHLGHEEEQSGNAAEATPVNAREQILAASEAERPALVEACLQDVAARVMRLDRAKLEPGQSLIALGLDSLMAVELKNRIEPALGAAVSVVELLQGLTIGEIAQRLLAQMRPETGQAMAA